MIHIAIINNTIILVKIYSKESYVSYCIVLNFHCSYYTLQIISVVDGANMDLFLQLTIESFTVQKVIRSFFAIRMIHIDVIHSTIV